MQEIPLAFILNYLGAKFTYLETCTSGFLSLNHSTKIFGSLNGPLSLNPPGAVYFRNDDNQTNLQTISDLIKSGYANCAFNISITNVFVATWSMVESNNFNFQLVIATDENYSFLIYKFGYMNQEINTGSGYQNPDGSIAQTFNGDANSTNADSPGSFLFLVHGGETYLKNCDRSYLIKGQTLNCNVTVTQTNLLYFAYVSLQISFCQTTFQYEKQCKQKKNLISLILIL